MAYLDSAGNVDPTAGANVAQWAEFYRKRGALNHLHITPTVPAASLVSGGEKAARGHD